ncbi:MAG: hypothetical protein V1872_00895 [bacterium]
MKNLYFVLLFTICYLMLGCTTTSSIVSEAQPLSINKLSKGYHFAVAPFTGAPNSDETGIIAQKIVTDLLVTKNYEATLVSPSKVDSYFRTEALVLSEHDYQALETMASSLKTDIIIWGNINQYTPYSFNRLAPATPPYIEMTLFGFQRGNLKIAKVKGHKQGGLPITIWDRQPTFEDIAKPLADTLLRDLIY